MGKRPMEIGAIGIIPMARNELNETTPIEIGFPMATSPSDTLEMLTSSRHT